MNEEKFGEGLMKKNCVMKGFGVVPSLVIILTVILAGAVVMMSTWSGATPIYYQNMPESKFGDLLMLYEHLNTTIKQSVEQDSDRIFATMGDFPIEWKAEYGKNTLSDPDWSKLYSDQFNSGTGKYFGSVKNLGFEWINISFEGSSVKYDSSSPSLVWNFVYKLTCRMSSPRKELSIR
jgi:hypothetical protein